MTILYPNGTAVLPDKLKTDLKTYHIEGIAREDPTQTEFDIPLFSHVTGNLWQGGCIGGVNLQGFFDHIISLYPWERYEPGKQLKTFVEVQLYDGPTVPDMDQLVAIADIVDFCRHKGPTLVHCQAGLNRSGLVAGLALVRDSHERNTDADKIIALLRAQRCQQVLCNQAFEKWLRHYSDQYNFSGA